MIEINSKNLPMIILGLACVVLFCLGANAYLFSDLQKKEDIILQLHKRIANLEKGLDTSQTEIALLAQKGSNPTRTETIYEISYDSHENQDDGFKEIEKEEDVLSAINQWDKKTQDSISVDLKLDDDLDYKKLRNMAEVSRRMRESETRRSDSLEPPVKKKGGRKRK
jgi:hypothetical protein